MGARIMLRRNVCTADGLVDGAMGTIVGFEWPQVQRTANTQPSGISVLFDNCKDDKKQHRARTHGVTSSHLVKMCLLIGMAHVVLSRVKSLEGVCIIGLSRSASHKNDIAVHAENQRLANLNLM